MPGFTTRCKFRCESVKSYNDPKATADAPDVKSYEDITLRAHYDESPENKVWSKWTPSGMFQMSVTNPAVFGRFTEGKDYYLDITEAE